MIKVQKIACTNHGWFDMSFAVLANGTSSPSTGTYHRNDTRVIDLSQCGFQAGTECWPQTHAELGRTIASDDHIVYEMNGVTANYEIRGTTLDYSVSLVGHSGGRLPDFPAGIPLGQYAFINWAGDLTVANLWTCEPRNTQDVVDVCNWAASHSFRVRARGFMHGWSPLTVTTDTSADSVLLVDLTKSLTQTTLIPAANGEPPKVRVGTGASMNDLLTYLEGQTGGSATGYSFPHTPAPGSLTVGGVLAINAHGTAVPTPPADAFPSGYGSMSNHILELTAVVTDPHSAHPGTYALKTFTRGSGDDKAFLTHLGRAMVVEAVLEVIPNYSMRCQSLTDKPQSVLFQPGNPSGPPPKDSFADFVERYGRVEIIWFPFTDNPWLHLWQVAPDKPAGSRTVSSPYNYPFADNVDATQQAFLRFATRAEGLKDLTPDFGKLMFTTTNNGFDGKDTIGIPGYYPVSRDIWGPSRSTLLYIKDTTLKVTANGYAIQLRKADVQQAVHDFTAQYLELIAKYREQGKYPINSPLEIRVTGLDDPSQVNVPAGQTAGTPVISSLTYDDVAKQNGWDVALWLDVLTIPGTPDSNDFFTDLEAWLLDRFKDSAGRVFPEWSKGWGYTTNGPWTSDTFFQHIRAAFTDGRMSDQTWAWQALTLKSYDQANLFTNPLLDRLFTST